MLRILFGVEYPLGFSPVSSGRDSTSQIQLSSRVFHGLLQKTSREEVSLSPSQQEALPLHCWETKSGASLDLTQQRIALRLGRAFRLPSGFHR